MSAVPRTVHSAAPTKLEFGVTPWGVDVRDKRPAFALAQVMASSGAAIERRADARRRRPFDIISGRAANGLGVAIPLV